MQDKGKNISKNDDACLAIGSGVDIQATTNPEAADVCLDTLTCLRTKMEPMTRYTVSWARRMAPRCRILEKFDTITRVSMGPSQMSKGWQETPRDEAMERETTEKVTKGADID